MKLIVLTTIIALFFCLTLFATRRRKAHFSYSGEDENSYNKFVLIAFALTLIIVEGFRFGYQDTFNYKGIYADLSDRLTDSLNIDIEPGYVYLMWLLRKINKHPQFIILVSSVFIVFADFRFLSKYSYNLAFSLYLYFVSSFISNMNGIRQLIAASIISFAFPFAVEKKTIRYILVVLLSSTIHKSAIIMIPLYFVFSGRRWNTLLGGLVGFCAFSAVFPGLINSLIGRFFADSYTGYLNNYVGANIINVFIAAVPFSLGLYYHFKNKGDIGKNRPMDVLINMQAISFAFMVLATTMAQYARIGMYMRHATVISLPFVIDKVFEGANRQVIKILAVLLYFALFATEIILSNSRGYFRFLYLDFSIFG